MEGGNATILKKKISFQDSLTLPKDLSHVFVEARLKADVEHLESKVISVCSPDYIPEYIIKVCRIRNCRSNETAGQTKLQLK